MATDSIKGHLDLLLLSVLEQRPLHGYLIIQRLRERSNGRFDLPEGTVYPALHRLEAAGRLASRWTIEDGRRRRLYRLTGAGRSALEAERRSWRDFTRAVGQVVAT